MKPVPSSLTGMPVDEFKADVKAWLVMAKAPCFKRAG